MDERESEASISSQPPVSSRFSDWRSMLKRILRSGVASGLAIAAVVGFHFVYPLLVVHYVSNLSLSESGIIIGIICFLSVVFIPIGATVMCLATVDEYLLSKGSYSVRGWPWMLAVPSVVGLLIFLLIPILSIGSPGLLKIHLQLGLDDLTSGSWLILLGTIIMVGAEFGSGAVREFRTNDIRDSENGSNNGSRMNSSARNIEAREVNINSSNLPTNNLESVFDWQTSPRTGFEDVGGMANVKDDIHRRVITPLRHRSKAHDRFRVSAPTGILLYGPPGTGKSHLARAIAGELEVPFVELSQADLSSKWINESPMMIRHLFEEADEFDFCVIFIDEIDGLVAERGSTGHNEDSKVVSEFLARLGEGSTNYLIIAATNRPDQLDSALLRPGRFDEQFEIGLPGTLDREEIFKVQLRGRRPALLDADYTKLSQLSHGFSAADIVAVVERASLRAAERDARNITFDDLATSIE